jgi:hypothetical protein
MATRNKFSLAWTRDYESQKQFVYKTFTLEGSWSQPGDNRKLFTFEDSTILWRKKNEYLFSFDGSKANYFKKELCKRIYVGPKTTFEILAICITQVKFTQANLYMDRENIKQDQLVNVEAIWIIVGLIVLHITSVISRLYGKE